MRILSVQGNNVSFKYGDAGRANSRPLDFARYTYYAEKLVDARQVLTDIGANPVLHYTALLSLGRCSERTGQAEDEADLIVFDRSPARFSASKRAKILMSSSGVKSRESAETLDI